MSQKLGFWSFDKKLSIRMYFLLEYESTNGVLTFCKNNISRKNFILELRSKNLWNNQTARFFKLQYLTIKLRYEVEFKYVFIHSQKQRSQPVISSGYGQTCPKLLKSAIQLYLMNEFRYEVDFLYVIRHTQIHLSVSVHSCKSGLGMKGA